MINSNLLRSAIADAKAVRVTAYANAKASLQERFDKRFEAVFGDKLREEAEEEEGLQEVEAPNQVSGTGGEAKGPATKAVSSGQPKKKTSGTDFKPVKAGKGPSDVGNLNQPVMENAEEEEESKVDEVAEEEEAKLDEAGLTSEDLDEIIAELENEVSAEEQGQQVPPEIGAEVPPSPEGEEEIPIDGEPTPENGDEIPGEEPEGEPEDEPNGDEIPTPEDDEIPHAEPDGDEGVPDEVPDEVPSPELAPRSLPPAENQEEINLEELLAALNEEAEEEEEEAKMDEIANNGVPTNDQCGKATVKGYPKTGQEKTSPGSTQIAGKNHNIQGKGNIGDGSVAGGLKEVTKYKVALSEAYKTIEFLRGQINEVNLLNAKLLYTNKLFKDFATVIDESYRMKIVEAFDLTKSVREVKLAYALLAESLNFGRKRIIASTKPTSKVDPVKKAIARQITEGYASKPVASTKPSREIISEGVNEMAARFQKLAGIKMSVGSKK